MIRESILIDENKTIFGVEVNKEKRKTGRRSSLLADQAITNS